MVTVAASDFDHSTTSGVCSTTTTMPTAIGATTMTIIASVITATARPRRPPRRPCTARITGHVATTIMVAQISAGRNGRSTQNVAAINPPIATTASRIRVTSHDTGRCSLASRA